MKHRGYVSKNLKKRLIALQATEILRPFVSNRKVTCVALTHVKQLNDFHIEGVDSEIIKMRIENNAKELPEESFRMSFYSLLTIKWNLLRQELEKEIP